MFAFATQWSRNRVENDLVEAIIGLPTDMFYNTGIATYIWVVTNRKPEHRRGKGSFRESIPTASGSSTRGCWEGRARRTRR